MAFGIIAFQEPGNFLMDMFMEELRRDFFYAPATREGVKKDLEERIQQWNEELSCQGTAKLPKFALKEKNCRWGKIMFQIIGKEDGTVYCEIFGGESNPPKWGVYGTSMGKGGKL